MPRFDLRFAPLIRLASVGMSDSFYKNGSIGVNLASPLDGLSLRSLVITDSLGIRPADRIIAFLRPPFYEQFSTHVLLLF